MDGDIVTDKQNAWIKAALLVGIIGLAAFFRLYRIDSLPPGDSYDPAFYGIDALSILKGNTPIFFEGNFGREPLFSYLLAFFFLLFGPSTQTIHLASAFVGILTIPATYWVAKELFSEDEEILKEWGGLVAALVIAISYWHLNWSRFGVRAVLVPLFAAVTFYLLWRGLRTGKRSLFIACGGALGLSLYTYQAARLLPLLVVFGFIYYLWDQRPISRQDCLNFVLVVGVSCLVFAPLSYYFITHPGSFSERIDQVFVLDIKYFLRSLLFLNFGGDTKPLVTIPGRPALNPFLSLLFFGGIGLTLARVKKPNRLFLLTWLGGMLLLAAVAGKETASKRAVGAIPAVAMLIAMGGLLSWQKMREWLLVHRPGFEKPFRYGWAALLSLGMVYTGWVTYRDYFIIWPSDPDLFTHFQVGVSAIGRYIKDLPADEKIYVSPEYLGSPCMLFNSGLREGVKSYNGRVCMVVPLETRAETTYVVVPNDDKQGLELLEAYFPQGEVVAEGPLHYNLPYFLAYRVPEEASALITPSHVVEAVWADKIVLLGYDLDKEAYLPGETIQLTLYYRALERMTENYTVYTHLVGSVNPATGETLWGQDDSEPCRQFYRTSAWDLGEVVRDQFTIVIPADAPPGTFDLQMGLYLWPSMEQLPRLEEGQPVAGPLILGQVTVMQP